MTVFAILAVLLSFAAVGLVAWPLLRGGSTHPVATLIAALGIPAAVLVVYLSVSNHDWQGTPARSAETAVPGQASMAEAVAALEQRLRETPDDEQGWILLGSSYLSLGRPDDARNAYQNALELSGGRNMDARLGIAETRIIADPGSLAGPLGDEIEAVLAAEPRNPKALWYGGLLGLARGEPAKARERWEGLLALQPPEQIRQIIENQLAQLDDASGQTKTVASTGEAGANSIGISVTVSDAVRSKVSASAPLFVFVRDASKGCPPLAVIRRAASELPVTLQISDADLMIPGRSLANIERATVVARVANGGDPIAKPGDVYGEASWSRADQQPLAIVIDQVVTP